MIVAWRILLIIDLRENRGGRGDYAAYILPYFADKPFRQSAGEVRRVSQQFKDYLRLMPEDMLKASLQQSGLSNYMTEPNGTDLRNFVELESLAPIENRFTGKVWALIGSRTFSAGMMMANAIEDFDLATLVGEPTGGIPNELSDVLPVKTPNAKISFAAPSVVFTRANGDPSNTNPVFPDINIKTNDFDKEKRGDLVLDYVMNQIKKAK